MPGRLGSPTPGDLGVAGQQAVDERAACAGRRPGARPGRPACRPRAGASSSCTTGTSTAGSASRPAAAVAARARRPRRRRRRPAARTASVTTCRPTAHRARVDQRGDLGPAQPGDHGDDAVDPLPGQRLGHDLADRSSRAPPTPAQRGQHAGSPMPTQRAASATLNTGHHCRSTKSTTRPPRNPSPSRRARSTRLPSAPPRTTP